MNPSKSFDKSFKKSQQQSSFNCCKPVVALVLTLLCCWLGFLFFKVFTIRQNQTHLDHVPNNYLTPHSGFKHLPRTSLGLTASPQLRSEVGPNNPLTANAVEAKNDVKLSEASRNSDLDDTYHIVFSTGCSEFQDWQSIGVYSSAIAVGQRGIITRIASGCKPEQEKAIRHAMSHLPANCRVHFAPNTQVKDHKGHVYKYANKPLGMMHWLTYADPPIKPSATVALCDPDFFFLRPLYHDSFDSPSKYFATGRAKKTPVPQTLTKGTMIAQRYGIGGTPWRTGPGRNGQKAWDLKGYLTSIGRPDSPALAADLDEHSASAYYSFGAPYIALAEDWLPIATNWTALMPMAVERNFGNLAEMYACSIAVADYGIRPAMIDSLMVSNVNCEDEAWRWIDDIPMDRACDPTVVTGTNPRFPLPTFLHYCQGYKVRDFEEGHEKQPGVAPNWKYTKYQVPNGILDCPAGSVALEGGQQQARKKTKGGIMHLTAEGFLPEPPVSVDAHGDIKEHRNIFANCVATRATNQAAMDYRRWFCEVPH